MRPLPYKDSFLVCIHSLDLRFIFIRPSCMAPGPINTRTEFPDNNMMSKQTEKGGLGWRTRETKSLTDPNLFKHRVLHLQDQPSSQISPCSPGLLDGWRVASVLFPACQRTKNPSPSNHTCC